MRLVATALPGAAEKVSERCSSFRHPLDQGVDRRRQDPWPILGAAGRARPGQGRHPPCRNGGVGRNPIVGLAVPGRKGQDLDLRRDEPQSVQQGLLTLPVAGDVDQDGGCFGGAAQAARRSPREDIEPVRNARERQALPLLESVEGAISAAFMGKSVPSTCAARPGPAHAPWRSRDGWGRDGG